MAGVDEGSAGAEGLAWAVPARPPRGRREEEEKAAEVRLEDLEAGAEEGAKMLPKVKPPLGAGADPMSLPKPKERGGGGNEKEATGIEGEGGGEGGSASKKPDAHKASAHCCQSQNGFE
jgi:hypothetical protein